ncbi:hypothetical protein V6N11_012491 [Hibiscus sabdariffa]|uniref:Leucine-rich repeat-containing N-terminal plant-type domain-containing protein n=1 Tax=Hibiscus sabdariffa TaxID=183260 RepID=A0ABR2QB97_9ROSI
MKDSQRTQSSKETRHNKYDCLRFIKKESSSKKAYVAIRSDEEDSTDNEVAHRCLMALQEGEIHFNPIANWVGSNVCNYNSVYCVSTLDNKRIRTVVSIDLNHDDIVGYLSEEVRLLSDLALFHINTNRFCGAVPHKFEHLKRMFELDLSNNRFVDRNEVGQELGFEIHSNVDLQSLSTTKGSDSPPPIPPALPYTFMAPSALSFINPEGGGIQDI